MPAPGALLLPTSQRACRSPTQTPRNVWRDACGEERTVRSEERTVPTIERAARSAVGATCSAVRTVGTAVGSLAPRCERLAPWSGRPTPRWEPSAPGWRRLGTWSEPSAPPPWRTILTCNYQGRGIIHLILISCIQRVIFPSRWCCFPEHPGDGRRAAGSLTSHCTGQGRRAAFPAWPAFARGAAAVEDCRAPTSFY